MNRDLVVRPPKIESRELPDTWDWKEAFDAISDGLEELYKIGSAYVHRSATLMHQIWVAHENLTRQGSRTDLRTQTGDTPTWNEFCRKLKRDPRSVRRWLSNYDPLMREVTSDTLDRSEPADTRDRKSEVQQSPNFKAEPPVAPHVVPPTLIAAPVETVSTISGPDSGSVPQDDIQEKSPDIAPQSRTAILPPIETLPRSTVEERLLGIYGRVPVLAAWPPLSADERAAALTAADKVMRRLATLRRDLTADGPVDGDAIEKTLKQRVRESFTAKTSDDQFNWPRENGAVRDLVQRAMTREGPEEFLHELLTTYWELVSGSDSYWSTQPFLPSRLASSSVYAGVVTVMENGQRGKLSPLFAKILSDEATEADDGR